MNKSLLHINTPRPVAAYHHSQISAHLHMTRTALKMMAKRKNWRIVHTGFYNAEDVDKYLKGETK